MLVVDVSRNTRPEHTWLLGAVPAIDASLRTNGFGNSDSCRNHYGTVIFGQAGSNVNGLILFSQQGHPMVTVDQFSQLASQVRQDNEGSIEDGYEAIHLAMAELPLREQSNVFSQVLLVSDEDRDVSTKGESLDRDVIISLLRNSGFHAVVDNSFSAGGTPALGVTNGQQLHAVLATSSNWFRLECSGIDVARGYARTNQDYVQTALGMNGSAWDVKLARVPANNASLVNALAHSMVRKLHQVC